MATNAIATVMSRRSCCGLLLAATTTSLKQHGVSVSVGAVATSTSAAFLVTPCRLSVTSPHVARWRSNPVGFSSGRSCVGSARGRPILGADMDCKRGVTVGVPNKSSLRTIKTPSKKKSKPPESSTGKGAKPQKKKNNNKSGKKDKSKSLFRADRVLANRGVGSRSETFQLTKNRRVSMIDPRNPTERIPVKGPSDRIPRDAALFLDGKELPGPPPLMLLYHKPKHVLSAMSDDGMGRRHLADVLDSRYVKAGLHPVGRLDYDTTGLLLFSSEGELTQRLLHPRRGVEKEYVATCVGIVDAERLGAQLQEGVVTAEGTHTARLLEVVPADPVGVKTDSEESSCADVIRVQGINKEEVNDDTIATKGHDGTRNCGDEEGPLTNVRLVVSEGKHRMVRRMLANCGHPVVELRRERHGEVFLGDLGVGEFRRPTEEELDWAKALLSSKV